MTAHPTSDGRDLVGFQSPPRDSGSLFFPIPWSSSEMCAAGDVFLGGKILPVRATSLPPPTRGNTHLPKSLGRSRRGPAAAEYRRLRKVSEEEPESPPPPEKAHAAPRPSWYVLAFGSLRVPAEMEMRDIRTRQRRRNSAPASPPESGGLRGPWKLLSSLSCKGVETAAVVTAPLSVV